MTRIALLCLLLLALRTASGDDSLVELSEAVGDSVVHLSSDTGSGSGFVVAPDMVVTNFHVMDGAGKLTAKFKSGVFVQAAGVLHADPKKDIAVIRVMAPKELMKPLTVSKTLPKQGEDVAAFGNPLEFEFTVTRGIVSAIRSAEYLNTLRLSEETLDGTWIQTDAAISPGNSGGPLVKLSAEVIGMSTFVRREAQNLNLAISCVDIAQAVETATHAQLKTFAEVSSASADRRENALDGSQLPDLSDVKRIALSKIQEPLGSLTTAQLKALESGKFSEAFRVTSPLKVAEGNVARLAGRATVFQILDDSILLSLEGVRFRVAAFGLNSAELAAKVGDDVVTGVPIDGLYFIGKAESYLTVAGTEGHYIPILPLERLIQVEDLQQIVGEERARRSESESQRAVESAERASQTRIRQLSRTFSDATGKFKIDAVIVQVDEGVATLIRMNDRSAVQVPISRLSTSDKTWISDNDFFIRRYGPEIRARLTTKPE